MSAFAALVMRDLRLAARTGGGILLGVVFFAAVAVLVPFGVGTDPMLLAAIAPGIVWVAAALAALLALDRMFQADFEDGTLDVLATAPVPLTAVAGAKALVHWLTTGVPVILATPAIALLYGVPQETLIRLLLALAAGTPALSLIGLIGAAVTLSVRRGGLLLALIVLPLLTPVLIFGAGAATGEGGAAFLFLGAISLACLAAIPPAAAATLRLQLH